MKIKNCLVKILINSVLYVCVAILALVTFFCSFYVAFMPMSAPGISVIRENGLAFYMAAGGLLTVICGMIYLCKNNIIIGRKGRIVAFIIAAVIWSCASLILIRNIDLTLRADQEQVFLSARQFIKGDFSALRQGHYLNIYPHQLGLVYFEMLLLSVSNQTIVLFISWMLLTLLAIYIIAECSAEENLLGITKECNFIVVSVALFCFAPLFFFQLFIYGITPGLTALALSLLCAIKAQTSSNNRSFILYCAACSLMILIASMVRSNYLIGGIALSIAFIIKWITTTDKKCIVLAIAIIICATSSAAVVRIIGNEYTGIEIPNGMPKILWLGMGIGVENNGRSDGWYNGYNYDVFIENKCDASKSKIEARNDIRRQVEYWCKNKKEATEFFSRKIITSWCDPLMQSVWSGPLQDCQQYTHLNFIRSIYSGGRLYLLLNSVFHVILWLIYFGNFFYWLNSLIFKKNIPGVLATFSLIFFAGGFVFHLFWETKSQYMLPYVVLLIPVALSGLMEFALVVISGLEKIR